jgi:hypothetical protein
LRQYVHHLFQRKAKTFLTAHENCVNSIRCNLSAFSDSSFSKDPVIAYFQMAPQVKMRGQVIVVAIPELLPHVLRYSLQI